MSEGYDIYYAHHQWKYGTKIEQYELDLIRRYFPKARICNPATDIDNVDRTEEDIMRDCLETVKNSDIIVFSAVDGCIGRGVYQEVTYADKYDKIIFFINHDQLISVKGYSLKRVKSAHGDRIYAYVVKED